MLIPTWVLVFMILVLMVLWINKDIAAVIIIKMQVDRIVVAACCNLKISEFSQFTLLPFVFIR